MLSHIDAGRDVWIKFAVETYNGPEHVWARVAGRSGDRLQCQIETPPVAHVKHVITEVQAAAIEDWQVELEDGNVRGGFTTLAQTAIAKREGRPVPKHVQDIASRIRN